MTCGRAPPTLWRKPSRPPSWHSRTERKLRRPSSCTLRPPVIRNYQVWLSPQKCMTRELLLRARITIRFSPLGKNNGASIPPRVPASLASALACKYVVTGDGSYRKQTEEMMANAKQMAQGNDEDRKGLEEYFP